MPYRSMAQERFAHTPTGRRKFGPQNVEEFDAASKDKKLPERAPQSKELGHRIMDLVKKKP